MVIEAAAGLVDVAAAVLVEGLEGPPASRRLPPASRRLPTNWVAVNGQNHKMVKTRCKGLYRVVWGPC